MSTRNGSRAWLACALGLSSAVAWADNFAGVRYDAPSDSIVVKMRYSGTNPDHAFTLKWGACKDSPDGSGHQIVAEVLDSQWQDAAQRVFTKTTSFPLDRDCRPAQLTLRTAPRFYVTLRIPGPSAKEQSR